MVEIIDDNGNIVSLNVESSFAAIHSQAYIGAKYVNINITSNMLAFYNTTLICDTDILIDCNIYCVSNDILQFLILDETCSSRCTIDLHCKISSDIDYVTSIINNIGASLMIHDISSIINQFNSDFNSRCDTSNANNLVYDIGSTFFSPSNIQTNHNNSNGTACCRGFESCADSVLIATTKFGNILCLGDSACAQSVLTTINTIHCMGYDSCISSTLQSSKNVICGTYGACKNSFLMNISTLYCFKQSCINATMKNVNMIYVMDEQYGMNIESGNKNDEVFVYFAGNKAGYNTHYQCHTDMVCNIDCGIGACDSNTTIIHCDGKCFVTCSYNSNQTNTTSSIVIVNCICCFSSIFCVFRIS